MHQEAECLQNGYSPQPLDACPKAFLHLLDEGGDGVSQAFTALLLQAQRRSGSWVCVGLDPVPERLPASIRAADNPLMAFGCAIVEATADVVCAFKPNLAFWLAAGVTGLAALKAVIAAVPEDVPVVLDAKFGDIGHTAASYARAAFDELGADAVTLNPYLGVDAVRPFLEWEGRGVFLLARTSNPSAGQVQDLQVEGRPLYQWIAGWVHEWAAAYPGACGLVVGATYPQELADVRSLAPDLPFLIPGVGAQGGSLADAVAYGPSKSLGPLINSSRGIIFASAGPDFAEAARAAAVELNAQITAHREAMQR
jgi:orotidine-5'-phosphate decarboxylase